MGGHTSWRKRRTEVSIFGRCLNLGEFRAVSSTGPQETPQKRPLRWCMQYGLASAFRRHRGALEQIQIWDDRLQYFFSVLASSPIERGSLNFSTTRFTPTRQAFDLSMASAVYRSTAGPPVAHPSAILLKC